MALFLFPREFFLTFFVLFAFSAFRLASPRHGFTIMNRLSMKNLTEPITKDLDFQLQHPFLLYRNARCKDTLILCYRLLGEFYMLVIFCHVNLNCPKNARDHLVAVSHHWKEVWSHLNSWNGEKHSSLEWFPNKEQSWRPACRPLGPHRPAKEHACRRKVWQRYKRSRLRLDSAQQLLII